ncbi:hypothetical protein T484DRAFT_1812803 [Baffinella frigidus]|nr:hypothetical protein T484DRAFT_1812803 [Cryptophyta sp. CCMP2293]
MPTVAAAMQPGAGIFEEEEERFEAREGLEGGAGGAATETGVIGQGVWQLSPAKDVAGLRRQLVLLQDELAERATREQRLALVNHQLKQRLEEAMRQNNANVEAAETELTRLAAEAEQAREAMQRVMETNNRNVDSAQAEVLRAGDAGRLEEREAHARTLDNAVKQARAQAFKEMAERLPAEVDAALSIRIAEEREAMKEAFDELISENEF